MPSTGDKVAIGATTVGGTAAATGGILTGMGFTTSGIAAGSTAAGMQAGIGNVVAGSIFSGLQSLGATGVIAGVGIGGGVILVAGGGFLGYKAYQWMKNKDGTMTPKPNL
jgi:hypothetical protein